MFKWQILYKYSRWGSCMHLIRKFMPPKATVVNGCLTFTELAPAHAMPDHVGYSFENRFNAGKLNEEVTTRPHGKQNVVLFNHVGHHHICR